MKMAFACVVCGSTDLVKKFGQFAPFVAHRLFDYPICKVEFGGAAIFPTTLTNALRCRACGFVFSQMRPDDDEMARLYAGYRGPDYVRERDAYEPGYAHINPLIGDGAIEIENRQAAMAEFLVGLGPSRRVLDYGGDRGQHIPRIFAGSERIVFDISGKPPLDGIRAVGSLADVGEVDFVMLSNVLEHVSYPRQMLNEVIALTAPSGRLFIDVPLEMSAEAEIPDEQIPAYFHEHINFFTPRSLTRLIEGAHFVIERLEIVEMDFGWTQARSIFALASAG